MPAGFDPDGSDTLTIASDADVIVHQILCTIGTPDNDVSKLTAAVGAQGAGDSLTVDPAATDGDFIN